MQAVDLSLSEIKRLRNLIEQDWPSVEPAIQKLATELTADGIDNVGDVIQEAVNRGLAEYRRSIYIVNTLGKISDPVRLAAFVSGFLESIVKQQPGIKLKQCAAGCANQAKSSEHTSRECLYMALVDDAIRKTLRVKGYEQKILVGGCDRLFHAAVGGSDFHPYGVGS